MFLSPFGENIHVTPFFMQKILGPPGQRSKNVPPLNIPGSSPSGRKFWTLPNYGNPANMPNIIK